ncbi:hypothetical protein [Methylobacterium fujisawaense]
MPRLGSMILDGLAFLLAAIALTAVVVGYERNLPDPGASRAEGPPAWIDPVTTGAITPAAPGAASRWADAQLLIPAADTDRPHHADGGAWVNPPRR